MTAIRICPMPNGDGYSFTVDGQQWNHLIVKDGVEVKFIRGMAQINITLVPSSVSIELPDAVLAARYVPEPEAAT